MDEKTQYKSAIKSKKLIKNAFSELLQKKRRGENYRYGNSKSCGT